MRNHPGRRVAIAAAALMLAAALPVAASDETSDERVGDAAFEYAFRFASSIYKDPRDRARAQALVVADLLERDQTDLAIGYADRIAGWRRGIAYAEIARHLADSGDRPGAIRYVRKSEEIHDQVGSWQQVRVAATIAQAHAALGDVDRSRRIGESVAAADARQYGGRAVATVATGYASGGDFERAMAALHTLDAQTDFDVVWWRTQGFIDLGNLGSLARPQRIEALVAARQSLEGVEGWKFVQGLNLIAESYDALGETDRARAVLGAGDAYIEGMDERSGVRVPLAVMQARSWIMVGEKDRARGMLALGESTAGRVMNIEVPAALAQVGGGYARLGDPRQAERLFAASLEAAGGLQNARPRALALVSICRVLGQENLPLTPETRQRLDALYAGLGDPW